MSGGLYNMIMGHNPALPLLAGIVGITQQNAHKLGRLRDAYITADAKQIFVLHRNYGEDGEAADAEAAQLPTYVRKVPCEHEDTYAYYEFSVPSEFEDLARQIADATDNTPCMDKYMQLVEDMKSGKDTPEVRRAMEAGKRIFTGLDKAVETGDRQEVGEVVITPMNPEEDKT